MKISNLKRIERVILEASLALMFKNGYFSADLESVASQTMINANRIKEIYETDDCLRMTAMKYAAQIWVDGIRDEISKIDDPKEKLKKVIRHYVAGTVDYPDSLSLYIDVWKLLRDGITEEHTYIRNTLSEIYHIYVDLFIELFRDFSGVSNPEIDYQTLGWIMVVISDGFHIQSLIQKKPLDFNRIEFCLSEMIEASVWRG